MTICERCKMIGGYHHDWCPVIPVRFEHVNRIRYPRPNVLGARRTA